MPPKLDIEELKKRATYHPPSDRTANLHTLNREFYLEYAKFIMEHIPESREASIAQTNLEQVLFWVNAAIARNV